MNSQTYYFGYLQQPGKTLRKIKNNLHNTEKSEQLERLCLMVRSVPSGQLVFSSRPIVKTVRYFRPLVGTSGQLGEYFVRRVRQFMRPSPSWRGEMTRRDFILFINPRTVHVYALLVSVGPYRKLDARSIIIRQLKTASPHVRLFSAATSARDVRVTMEISWQFQCFS